MPRAKRSSARKTTTAKKKTTAASKRTTKKTTKKTVAKKKTSSKRVVKKAVSRKTTLTKKKTATIIDFPTQAIAKKQTKSEIINDIAAATNLEKKIVKMVFESLKNHIIRHMKTRGSGEMVIPELGIKIRRVKKSATKRRKGRNPFTGEEIMIAAKPARTVIKAIALKVLKEMS